MSPETQNPLREKGPQSNIQKHELMELSAHDLGGDMEGNKAKLYEYKVEFEVGLCCVFKEKDKDRN